MLNEILQFIVILEKIGDEKEGRAEWIDGDSAGRAMIVGALAGAAYGIAGIPDTWLNAKENSGMMMAQAKQLGA